MLTLTCSLSCDRLSFELDVSHNVKMLPSVIMKAKDGIKLIFTARY